MNETPEDDWFGSLDLQPRPQSSELPAEESWLYDEHDRPPPKHRPRLATFADRRLLLGAGLAGAVVLVILAVSGVFSGGKQQPSRSAGTTTTPRTTTTAAVTTTPVPRVAALPTTALAPGATGAEVKLLQRALARLGYSVGPVDGIYGGATRRALASFQRANHLAVDGVLGPKTLRALARASAAKHTGPPGEEPPTKK